MDVQSKLQDQAVDGRVHIMHDNAEHRYTIAYIIHHEDEEVGNIHFKAAISMCGPDDNFNRALGRQIAMGRLACGRRHASVDKILEDAADCGMPEDSGDWRRLDAYIEQRMLDMVELPPLPAPPPGGGDPRATIPC